MVGTATVLDVAREAPGLRAILSVTSDKCYESREWVYGYRENDPMGGYDPYSSSKGCAELVSSAFRSSYFSPARHADHGVAMATARAGKCDRGWGLGSRPKACTGHSPRGFCAGPPRK